MADEQVDFTDGPVDPIGTSANRLTEQKASPSAPTMPDGEKDSTNGNRADAKPGDPSADPQNLAKDAQANGGVVGTEADALGQSSLGQSVGTAVREGDHQAEAKVIEDQPEQRDAVRVSHAESGDYSK